MANTDTSATTPSALYFVTGQPNPLLPVIWATVLLSGILITIFTAARLVGKRLISGFDIEDCK